MSHPRCTLLTMSKGPRISVGQAATAFQCQRHAAKLLDPEQARARTAEGAFRLNNAITVAIVDAHRAFSDTNPSDRLKDSLVTALEACLAPPELGHEEAARFAVALAAYAEAFGSDRSATAVVLHAKADSSLAIPVGDRGAALTGKVSLAFSTEPASPHSSSICVRSVVVGTLGGDGNDQVDALRLAALGADEGTVERLAVTPTGSSHLTTKTFDREQIRQAWRAAGDMVDAAIAAGEHATPTAGWWCANCAFTRHCPAVSSERFIDLHGAYPVTP